MEKFIEESKKIIKRAAENNKLVVFVGAGVSANSGLPSWNDIVNDIKEKIGYSNNKKEDNTIIAQYFYNARGKKEYYDFLNSKLNISVSPNEINDKILDLNPYHIITTNYDDLIEKQAEIKGMFYDVVAKDADLPYTPNDKMIIKMHGDFTNRNIVFKEDDYLSYSTNFKLIENFVKSLFATHTILFLGYSLADPDIKYIFKFVKDILSNDLPKPYFLKIEDETDEKIDFNEYQYYKNMGINILYYSQIDSNIRNSLENKITSIQHYKGKKTLAFVNYLLDEYENKTFDLFEYIKNFKNINFIDRKYLVELLNTKFSLLQYGDYEINKYTLILKKSDNNKDKIKSFIEIFEKNKNEKSVIEFLNKLGIKFITIEDSLKSRKNIDVIYEGKNDIKYTDIDEIIRFNDYEAMKKKVNEYSDVENIDLNLALQNAYLLFYLKSYIEAYKLYKRISSYALKNKEFVVYAISEFNRYYTGIFLINSFRYDNIANKIKNEIYKIDLNKILFKFPFNNIENEILEYILKRNLIYLSTKKIIELNSKINKDEQTYYAWIAENSTGINRLKENLHNVWKFINYNYLTIDNIQEVRNIYYYYCNIIVGSFMTPKKVLDYDECFIGDKAENIVIEKFEYFDIMIMLKYISITDLENIFGRYNVKEIEISDIEHIYKLISNILKFDNSRYMLKNILYLFSKIKLEEGRYGEFNKIICQFFSKNSVYSDEIKYLNSYIYNQYEMFKNFNIEFGEFILKLIIQDLKKENISFKICTLIHNVSSYIHIKDKNYILDEHKIVDKIRIGDDLIGNAILVNLYVLLDSNSKRRIKKLIKKYLKKEDYNYNDLKLYYNSVIKNIIIPELEFENKCIIYIDEVIKQNENEKKKHITSKPDILNELLCLIANLQLQGYIITKENFRKYYGKYDDRFDFLFDIESFDYSKIKLEWLLDCSDSLLQEISNNKNIVDEIKLKMKSYIEKGENINNEIIRIYFKYFSL